MRQASNVIKTKNDAKLSVERAFDEAMENEDFCSLCSKLNVDKKLLAKYTSKLENTAQCLGNCKGCKGLEYCKSPYKGYVEYPTVKGDNIEFIYTPCRYKKEQDKNRSKVKYYETPEGLKNAKFKDIFVDDKNRVELLRYIKTFMKDYPNVKGIYLYGSFGSGKSYILNAILNELSAKNYSCISVYYPSLLRKLKDSFENKDYSYRQVYTELEMCDCLLLDDIGAENNTDWSRDEILGSLLQSRMDNKKITFFSSNLNIEELNEHLSKTKSGVDKLKSRRIIERVLELSTPIALISDDRRENTLQ